MDKLRAIHYFNGAVESGSFAAAARAFGVSAPAITQLVGALERSLGIVLFHRTTQGITLTADGARYYEVSRAVATDLHEIEQRLGTRAGRLRGTLSVGLRGSLGPNCLIPRIGRFVARYPDIELALTPIAGIADLEAKNLDLVVLIGWPPERDLAVRPLAQTRHVVCAAPEYLARAGVPRLPEDLLHHECMVIRSSGGTLVDRWIFERDGDRRTVDVKARLFCDDRTWLDAAACAGLGVIRPVDLSLMPYLASGALVPILTDWESLEAPTIFAAYPRSQRQSKLVRVFVDFLVEVFAELERARTAGPSRAISHVPKPEWFGRAQGLQSAFGDRRRQRDA